MSSFEFVLSLLGLMLGFSLAELLGGLLRVLRARARTRIGLLTPALALFVALDLTSFWANAWDVRQLIAPSYGLLVFGLLVSAVYFLAAASVFPKEPKPGESLDDHYYRYRRPILAGVGLCNAVVLLMLGATSSAQALSPLAIATHSAYYAFLLLAAWPRARLLNLFALAGLIALYLYFAVLTLLLVPVPPAG